ncbi:MAG: hypothetical protein LBT09_09300 [Planctomycetaceae bacterium]|jgi:hypothetical protein|nr:hypothetical protein [Planctomycetaceae bacterium]
MKKFIGWVYSFDDFLNPIVVREVRRELRSGGYAGSFPLCLVLFTLLICLNFLGVIDVQLLLDVFWMCCWIMWVIGFFSGCLSTCRVDDCTVNDETFFLVPLSPRQYLHAHLTLSILLSLYRLSLSLPPILTIIFMGHSFSLLVIPATVFLASQTVNLVLISSIAQAASAGIKHILTVLDYIKLAFLIIINFFVFVVWFIFLVAYIDYLPYSLQDWESFSGINLFHIFLAIIVMLTNCRLAYKLSLRSFDKNYKPRFIGLFHNARIYFLFNTIMAIIYYLILKVTV